MSNNNQDDMFIPHLLEKVKKISVETLNLIDRDFLNEIKIIVNNGRPTLLFGKTLRDIKCVLLDDNQRAHEILIQYKGPKKLIVVSANLPHTPFQDKEYKSIEELVTVFHKYINDLAQYFSELERIDRFCTVTEPVNPTLKDDYRRILLGDRTWLHVEVTPDGLATNIHLVGQSEIWHNKLQTGLLSWDHDKDIVDNIMTVFEITEFPSSECKYLNSSNDTNPNGIPTCSICLCDQLPDYAGLPQPLCQNKSCGVYFHRMCLYQWLVACSGNRPPAFAVATGACPACLQPIVCSERDT